MLKITMVKKNLPAKKVAVFSDESLEQVAVWLKPGDKLKYKEDEFEPQYIDRYGRVDYRKVYHNGQAGYIIADALGGV